ncbi:MAG: hypothetical protein AAFY29_17860 [Pseudomonadota bacterium]
MKNAPLPKQGPLAQMKEELDTRVAFETCYNRFGLFVLFMLLPLAVFAYLTYESTGQFPATAASAALAVYAIGVCLGEVFIRRALKSALGLDKAAAQASGQEP